MTIGHGAARWARRAWCGEVTGCCGQCSPRTVMIKLISNRCRWRRAGGRHADGVWALGGSSSDRRARSPSSFKRPAPMTPPSGGPCGSSSGGNGTGRRAAAVVVQAGGRAAAHADRQCGGNGGVCGAGVRVWLKILGA
jgi:hypothetical protein